MYLPQKYPGWRYAQDGRAKIIHRPSEESPDWAEHPDAWSAAVMTYAPLATADPVVTVTDADDVEPELEIASDVVVVPPRRRGRPRTRVD